MTAIEELQSLVPRYHVQLECGPDSCTWWCYIGEWSNVEPTNWIAAHHGDSVEEAAANTLVKLKCSSTKAD